MRRFLLVLIAGCSGPGADSVATGTAGVGARPPNLLILVADDMGQDVVGAYGRHPDPPPTPVIDELASEGVRFRNAWAAPVCSPTRAMLLTGRYSRRYGVGDTINARSDSRQLSLDEVSLAAAVKQSPHGYTAIGAGKWHLAGWGSPDAANHPLKMGFDHFDGHMGNLNEDGSDSPLALESGYYWHEWARDGEVAWSDRYATTETVDHALERIAAIDGPWLAYVGFHAPHIPMEQPPSALATVTMDAPGDPAPIYRMMVQALDAEIGRLLDGLEPDVRANTVVIFAGDNGTSPSGTIAPWSDTKAKNSPYEGGIAVPLIVTGPGVVDPGREEDALVHVLDIFATATELAGVGTVEGADGSAVVLDSQSLVPFLTASDGSPGRDFLYTEKFGPGGPPPWDWEWNILRDERWKLIRGNDGVAFFDLWDPSPEDGNEGTNLSTDGQIPEDPEAAAGWVRLNSELDRLLTELVFEDGP